ncbi:MAG: hypothetical protein Kow0059_22790 [Candidatus Sumerlaeia bacterium]
MLPLHESVTSFLEAAQPQHAFETVAHQLKVLPDAAAELAAGLAGPLARLYDNYHVDAVERFAQLCQQNLEPAQAEALLAPIRHELEAARQWGRRLEAVHAERLVHELRDAVQLGDFKTAVVRLSLVLHPRQDDDTRIKTAYYIGGVLGSISTHHENVVKLLQTLKPLAGRLHLTAALLAALQEASDEAYAKVGRTGAAGPAELRDEFNSLVIDIQRTLPGRMEMREPDEEEVERFVRIGRALMRVPFRAGRLDHLTDATLVLLDFYPRPLSAAGARAGVQARAYQSLGYTAMKLCLLGLGRLADSPRLCQLILDFFKGPSGAPYIRHGIELMGAMRSKAFYPFLKEALEDSSLKAERPEVVKALGMIGEPEARSALLETLRDTLKARVIDPPRQKQAVTIIEALGRLTRSPRLSQKERVDLTQQTIALIPADQRRLTCAVATRFFGHQPDALPQNMRDWAAAQLVNGLWAGDETPVFAEGGELESDFLGTRKELVATLKTLGRDCLPTIIETAEAHLLNYNGAFLALGEVLAEIGDERAAPLLEKMILQVVNLDESAIGRYRQEFYWDAATRERRPLTKTHVIDTLIFALHKTGGAAAPRILREIAALYRRGKIGTPSEASARILLEAEKTQPGRPEHTDAPSTEAESEPGTFSDEDIRRAIVKLQKSGFLRSRDSLRQQKISAMQVIAASAAFDGLGLLIQHLDDKDRMTQEAAYSAIVNFGRRLTLANSRKTYLFELIEGTSRVREPGQKRLADLIQEFAANDPALARDLITYLSTMADPHARRVLSQVLLAVSKEQEALLEKSSAAGGGDAKGVAPHDKPEEAGKPLTYAEKLEAKRRYVQARKAWIESGKKGPEPPKPF